MSLLNKFFCYSSLMGVVIALAACDTMLRMIPMRELGPPPINPEFDAAAKAFEPEPGQSLLYVILDTQGKCDSADIWLNDVDIGRIFAEQYLYAPTAPGVMALKIQDYRITRKPDRHAFHTIRVNFGIEPDETRYIMLTGSYSEPCHFDQLRVKELSAKAGRALLSKTVLSRLNRHGFFERGMQTKSGTLPIKKDQCDGRLIADSNFTVPVACDYETQRLTEPDDS